ncbi:lipopolysaccharide biosynthesis protein [Mycolicibacterium pulveris]|uniref:lipopolysaccharide biosynthesis protein n=1 Tax=Mycolicibacterium pulveris TaxID=36813 RepID=UPI003CE69737
MAGLGKTKRAAATYLLLAALQRGVSLLILPFISHAMSPAQYGAASILTVSALLLVTIVAAPLEALVFRSSARGGEDAPALLRVTGLYCYAVLPLLVAIVAAGVAVLLPELFGVDGTIWGIELLAVGFQPAATYFALPIVRALQDLRKFMALAFTSVVVTAISKVLLIVVWDFGVLGWAISDLLSAIVSAALAMALVRLPRARVSTTHIRAVVNFSIPLIPHRASFWALSSLSRPALATVSSLTQVGLLSFGLNIAAVANLILLEIHQAFLPRYSRENFPAPTQETYAPVRWQLILAVTVPALVGAGLALTGQWIFAEPFWPSFALTGVLLVGQAACGLYLIPINYLVQSAGLPRLSAIASGSGALLILVGIYAVGRQFGAMGVAYATSVGFLVMAVVALILTRAIKLEIHWGSWRNCWPELSVGTASLACSVAALSLPVGSALSWGSAATCLVLVVSTLTITYRRHSLGASGI